MWLKGVDGFHSLTEAFGCEVRSVRVWLIGLCFEQLGV